MGSIIILDENTANKIAAGEVIERPASVIKELVENSIDAGADNISVEIRSGGISFIRVTDNGSGLAEDDVEIAFERHATSKIRRADDLTSVTSMGFRGEALASIAAVADVRLSTRVRQCVQGVSIKVKGGRIFEVKPAGCPAGTVITVRDLFFNTPARYKFLKKDSAEAAYAADILTRIALGHADISFKLISNGSTVFHTPGNGELKSAIFCVYGAETAKRLLEVSYQDEHVTITGFVGKAEMSRSNRNHQSVYINKRYVRNKSITSAIDSAYKTFLMKNRYAFALLNININAAKVDVNVHPSKMEIKFSNEQDIYRSVFHAVNNALLSQSTIRSLPISEKPSFIVGAGASLGTEYTQQQFDISLKESEQNRADAVSEKSAYINETQPGNGRMTNEYLKKDVKIIGQAFSTYILLEGEDELFLLDQHAAHERIRYEELKEAYGRNEPLSQTLPDVIHVELTPSEYQFAINEASFFEGLGITFEAFGMNSVLLRSAPFTGNDPDVGKMFVEVLDFVMGENHGEMSVVADKALYGVACKTAVKANKKLDELEIMALLDRMAALKNPYTCPHGRPAVFRLRRYELEKLFKRIV